MEPHSVYRRFGTWFICCALLVMGPNAILAAVQPNSDVEMSEITQAKLHIENGEFGTAASILENFISQQDLSEESVRYAYNVLVFTKFLAMRGDEARLVARDALSRFPDIHADLADFPSTVNDTYNELRRQMFGSLAVKQPQDIRVFMDGEFVGTTPLWLEYVVLGEHLINFTKSGFRDKVQRVNIEAGETLQIEPALNKNHGMKWWATRIVPAVAVGTALVLVSMDGDSGPISSSSSDFPPPPPPP